MLAGEPGIGKTSLADAIVGAASRRGFAVASGRCWEGGGAPALLPWMQIFDSLGLALPEIAAAGGSDDARARLRFFQAVTQTLVGAARARPFAIVLDDLHVADVSSLLLLQFVARELRRMRVLVVATRRDADAALTGEASTLLARIAREGTTLLLRRLAYDEVAAVIATHGDAIDAATAAAIWQATQGNPFFLDELLRLLVGGGGLAAAARGELPIPYGVREAIRQRLALLDEHARGALEVAAVAGVQFDPRVVALAWEQSLDETRARLDVAVRAGVLVERDDHLRFAHALIREVIDRDLPAGRRVALHLALAAALERMHPDAPPAVEIAHHALAAAPRDVDRTLARVGGAVSTLLAALAYEDAVALVERARVAFEPVLRDDTALSRLLLLVGETRIRAADVDGGRAAFRRAAAHARAAGNAVALARAAVGFGADFVISYTDPVLVDLLREALTALPAHEIGWRARVQARLAAALQPAPDPREPVAMAEQAIDAARALGDEPTQLDVIHAAMAAMVVHVPPRQRRPLNELAARLAAKLDDPAKELRAHLRLVFDLVELGELPAADARIDAYDRVAQRLRLPRHLWRTPLLHSMRALQEGRFAECDALIAEANALVAEAGAPQAAQCVLVHRWRRLRAENRVQEALALEPALGHTLAVEDRHLMVALLRADAGDADGARQAFELLQQPEHLLDEPLAIAVQIEVAACIGDVELARLAYERCTSSELWVCWGSVGVIVECPVAYYLGLAATLLGKRDEAARWLAGARARAEAAGATIALARVRAAQAALGEPDASAEPEAAPPAPPAWSLVRDGERWLVRHGGRTFHFEDRLGLHYLARLVAEPGRELHVLDLAGSSDASDHGDAGALLDAEARRAYRHRLDEIEDELREAEAFSDPIRASRAAAEREFLAAELARAVGLGGRERRAGAAAERARVAVTRRIKDAIQRIGAEVPELGRYLAATVRTGRYCSYRPV